MKRPMSRTHTRNGSMSSNVAHSASFTPGHWTAAASTSDPAAQDQLKLLRKQLAYKESEYNKDKAIWVQNYELVSHQLSETREQLEKQKTYYLQIISTLKLSYSPVK